MKKKPKNQSYHFNNYFDEHDDFIDYVKHMDIDWIKTNKRIEFANIPCVVDIESSSFYDNGIKCACMYCFTIGINGHSYFGRTWDEMMDIFQLFTDTFGLSKDKRLIIYVHNLAYEFQFFYKRFTWTKIFAVKRRTPLTALTTGGIEFRCSFLLSGYSLEKVGEHLQKYKVNKMVGDLDYEKIRHSETPMTETEKGYVLNDGLVVMSYIQEQIESHGNNITKIPLTKTGEVRKYVRNACLYGGGGNHRNRVSLYADYRKIMKSTRIISVNEYKQLKRGFSGGFTHANALIVGRTINDVISFDFTSSYPYVMVSEKFPMGRGELISVLSKEQLMNNLHKYNCIFDVTFFDLESTISFEHYISLSHCRNMKNYRLDNGRIVDADELTITITEQDYFIIEQCYKWSKISVKNFRRYKRDYLPKPFVESVLKLYKDKTELKGVKDKEIEYLYSKELVNSCYGMCVTDICREETPFNINTNTWDEEPHEIDYATNLERYNNSPQRFLSYAWGIWVTAYARRNLWRGILEFKNDYLYSDTDSIKVINADKHMKFIIDYNNDVKRKLSDAMNYHHLPVESTAPMTIKGEIKTLGVWENETEKGYQYTYDTFKTLGAKRYMYKYPNGTYSLTISGLNKKVAMPYLEHTYSNVFDAFKEDMYIPPQYTGKNTHTYIDEQRDGIVRDYTGKIGEYHELSCVHMENAEYTLSMAKEYIEFLLSIRIFEYN